MTGSVQPAEATEPEFIVDNKRQSITRELERLDKDQPHVRDVFGSLEAYIELPIDEVRDALLEELPPDTLFTTACLYNKPIFTVVRSVLEAAKVPVLQDRTTGVSIKVARSFYDDPSQVDEALSFIHGHYQSRATGAQLPQPDQLPQPTA